MKLANYAFALAGVVLALALAAPPAQADVADPATLAMRNSPEAVEDLCRMARRGDAESKYQLAWVFAHGRGDERRDDWASYLFFAASSNGHAGAKQMLHSVSWPAAAVPTCMTQTSIAAPAPTVADAPATVAVRAPAQIEKLVRQLAPQYEVPPLLALAIIAVESNFDASALSPKNAMGLMQLIPQTAQRFGVRNAFDAQQNVRGGLAYLRWLLAYFEGNVTLVAAAYNAGEGAVDRHRGVPPFNETREYVRRVIARVGSAPQPFNARITPPSPKLGEMGALASVN
jgi:soluble lytic murein transglycosylase-like protein